MQGGGGACCAAAPVIESVGSLWLNALRMTWVPGVRTAGLRHRERHDAMATGRLATRGWWCSRVAAPGGTLAVLGSWVAVALAGGSRSGRGVRGRAARSGSSPQPWPASAIGSSRWCGNVVQAAAEDAILALVVFATLFGFAATRLPLPSATR